MPALDELVNPLTDKPGNSTALSTPGCFSAISANLTDHFFSAIEGRTVGQLRDADQILLVLRGNEAARHDSCPSAPRRRAARRTSRGSQLCG